MSFFIIRAKQRNCLYTILMSIKYSNLSVCVCVCVDGISVGSRSNYSVNCNTLHRSVEENISNRGQGLPEKPTHYSAL